MRTRHTARIPRLTLQKDSETTLQTQLYRGIRDTILHGALQPGEQLPATRTLATELSISRTTVKLVYDQLASEGYTESSRGAGTFVAHDLPISKTPVLPPIRSGGERRSQRISERGKTLAATPVTARRTFNELRPFRAWVPSTDEFPLETWARLMRKHWSRASAGLLRYGGAQGYKPLRQAIANHIRLTRGVVCEPEQIMIVAGSQEALLLCGMVLGDPGDRVAVENPGYIGARGAFRAAGMTCVPVSVDDEGISIEQLQKIKDVRMAFVTPSHQYPLGAILPLTRRLELLRWASENGALVIEDDYDSEFLYQGHPIPALKALDEAGSVLYIGSFSKVLAPSLRLGYIALPPSLVDPFLRTRALIDRGTPSVQQAVLAEFMEDGSFERHLRRMRLVYAERQSLLLKGIAAVNDDLISVAPSPIGMHLIAHLKKRLRAHDLAAAGARAGLDLTPLDDFYLSGKPAHAIMLGYTALRPRQIREGCETFVRVLRECQRGARGIRRGARQLVDLEGAGDGAEEL